MPSKKVAVTEDQFPADMPEFLRDQQSARGNEDVGMDDLTIPRIALIQDLSDQHKKNKDVYIEGAEVGMAFNTVSQRLYGSKLFIVPVYFRKEYVIWKDRKKGGGFSGSFPTLEAAEAERATLENPNDYECTDTAQHFVLVVDENGNVEEDAVISMSKSQMKPSRNLNTQVRMNGGDRFSRVYELSVFEDENKNGDNYQNWSVKTMGFVNEATYKRAEDMYESVRSGARDVSRDEVESEAVETPEDEF